MMFFKLLTLLALLFFSTGAHAHASLGHRVHPAVSRVDVRVHHAGHRHRLRAHRVHRIHRAVVKHVSPVARRVAHHTRRLHHTVGVRHANVQRVRHVRARHLVRAVPHVAGPRYASGETGVASWYGPGFHGRKTANGEVYNQMAATCAHKHAAFGTLLRVVAVQTGKSVTCRVNDRGPFVRGRIIDLSQAGARDLGIIGAGTASVRLEIVS